MGAQAGEHGGAAGGGWGMSELVRIAVLILIVWSIHKSVNGDGNEISYAVIMGAAVGLAGIALR